MKKILVLFLIVSTITTTSFAQSKSKKQEEESAKKVEYVDIKLILENQETLKLTPQQATAFKIKNEYIKRDLQKLNSKKSMSDIERNMHERELKASYLTFINRNLNQEQIDQWAILKKDLTVVEEEKDLKTVLKKLDQDYKLETKEIYRVYKHDRKLYYAQRNIAKKAYETKKRNLIEYYENKEKGIDEDQEEILTLEEIANLYKEYDDYYGKQEGRSALDYLDIKEEYQEEEEYDEYGNLIKPEQSTTTEEEYDEYGNLIN
ncbi:MULTISPECIES: hypothetical protein [Myroides]|uniref:Uncharacterized protein n=1 Tax=Myroides albus TaxID=2562892 RepID=A0A6I3LK96_9FLAO|nr:MULTISPECIES: hypothetical protein [Myroides]MTG96921.1 hypothetical protein [Myroides albus]MVX35386.1 hypothetical protein [Myroides sp. LoEW2-1]UVD78328.1 hypothetical protein NWE55_09280 [Myroides albus]